MELKEPELSTANLLDEWRAAERATAAAAEAAEAARSAYQRQSTVTTSTGSVNPFRISLRGAEIG